MNDKELQYFKDLQQKFQGGAVLPNELEAVVSALLEKIEKIKTALETSLNKSTEQATAQDTEILAVLTQQEKVLRSIKGECKDYTDHKTNVVAQKLNTQIDAIKKLIPELPDLTYLTEKIDKDIAEVEKKIPKELTPEQIRDKVESLEGDERVDRTAIKGIEELIIEKVGMLPRGKAGNTPVRWLKVTDSGTVKSKIPTTLDFRNNLTVTTDTDGTVHIDGSAGGSNFTVGDLDGTPTIANPTAIYFTNGSVTDNGDGTATVSTTGSGGGGDVSSNTASSVDSEIAIFSGTGGKTIKRATGTGVATITSGVLGTATTTIAELNYLSGVTSSVQTQLTGKQTALSGTGFVKISGTTISYDNSTYYLASNPSGYTTNTGTVTSVAMTVPTGLSISGTPITTSGTLALTLTSGYAIPTTAKQTQWDTAYTNRITSLTTTGSGVATLSGNVLNIPNTTYTLPTASTSVLGGVKVDGTTITISGGVISAATGGAGTVSSVSVVSANGFTGSVATATSTPAITIATSVTGLLKGNGTAISAATAGTDYQVPITLTTTGTSGAATFSAGTLNIPQYAGTTYSAGTGLTLTTGTFSVNTSQNIAKLSNLTSNGFVKTSGSDGTLSIDTSTYLTANQTITLTGNVTGSGTTSITTSSASKYIVQGTTDSTLSAAQFLGALGTGIVKNTTTTGVLSIAVAGDFPTLNQSTTGSAATLTTARTIGVATGDVTSSGSTFNGSATNTNAYTLATVNSNVGSFGSATQVGTFTVNAKGLITAAGNTTVTPAVGSITGLGTGVGTALAVNVGSAGAFVTFNGALGTPSSGTATNLTGTASGLTAGTVTTNANLTGDVTSVGNATAIAAGVIVNADINASAGILLSKTNISLTTTGTSGAATLNTTTGVINIPQYSAGGSSTATYTDQTPDNGAYSLLSGSVNSSNTVFTVSQGSYSSGTLTVYRNGQLLTQGASNDWQETTPASGTFTFITAPTTGDVITTQYQTVAGSSTGIVVKDEGSTLTSVLASLDFVGSGVTATNTGGAVTVTVGEQQTTTTSSSTPAPTGNTLDNLFTVTALAAGATFSAPSGTPVNGNKLTIRIKDNGTARSLSFDPIYRAIGVTLPTTTVVSKTLYLFARYNSADSKWDVLSVAQEA